MEKCEECSSFIEIEGQNVCKKCSNIFNGKIFDDQFYHSKNEKDKTNNQNKRETHRKLTKNKSRKNSFIKKILSKSNCEIPTVVKKGVIRIYKDLSTKKNKKGKKNFYGKKNLEYIVKGIYYYVCKKEQIGKSFTEIAMEFLSEGDKKNKKKKINEEQKIKKGFNDFIKLKIENFGEEDNDYHTMLNYINTYFGKDENKFKIKELCQIIFSNIDKKGFLGDKHLKTKVGLALLLSIKLFQENIDKKSFYVKFSGKYILWNAFKEIKDNLKEIIPDEMSDKLHLLQENNLFN